MEDVLAVYEKPLSEREPVVCIDEKPVVLHADLRLPRPLQPGRTLAETRNTNAVARPTRFRSGAQGGTASCPRDSRSFLTPVRRLYLGGCRTLSRSRHHPSGDGQSAFTPPQGRGGAVWRESRRLAVGPVHGALYTHTRKLAQSGGDRNQPVRPAVPGTQKNPLAGSSAAGGRGLGPEMNRDRVTIDWRFTRQQARLKFGYRRNNITRSRY